MAEPQLRPRGLVAAAWALGLAALAVLGLFGLRSLSGSAVSTAAPPFSSLRTDPSGTSLLFGAYARQGQRLIRSFDSDSLTSLDPGLTAAFVLAPEAWTDPAGNDLAARLLAFAQRGGWVVLAAPPHPPPASKPGSAAAELRGMPATGLEQRLGASLVYPSQPRPAIPAQAAPSAAAPPGALPLPLLDANLTLKLSPDWTPLFQRQGQTYMASRAVGDGRVILATEATFASNDNLARSPDLALLSWISGGRTTVWVDETLHNLQEDRGVAWLLRRYHLVPALIALLFALGLLAWNVGSSLERAPDSAPEAADTAIAIAESANDGYVRLLRRSLTPNQAEALLDTHDHP